MKNVIIIYWKCPSGIFFWCHLKKVFPENIHKVIHLLNYYYIHPSATQALPHTPPHLQIGQLQPWQRGSDGHFHVSLFEIQGLMKHGPD